MLPVVNNLPRLRLAVVLAAMCCTSAGQAPAAAPDWPQFRGPGARGIGESASLPEHWSASENVAWKTDLPGRGWSSPVVAGGRVLLTTVVNQGESEEPKKGLYFGGDRGKPPESVHQWKVYCLDLNSGKVLWDRVCHEGQPESSIHIKNSFASETPVTDGERVYACFGNQGLYCYDLDGNQVWSQKLPVHKVRFGWGPAASPVLHGEHLYVLNDNDEESYLQCLDKRTGQEVWKTVREDEKSNWATPYVWQNAQRTEIVTPGSRAVRSYDLSGKLLWQFKGMSTITIATPYEHNGLLYVTSGYVGDKLRPIYALRPGASGDISLSDDQTSNEYIAWCHRTAGPYNPSTIIYDGLLYVLYDRGLFACYDPATGEEVYKQQRIPDGKGFTTSPWAYNGKLFCADEDGVTFVIKAGRQFEVLHTNALAEEDMCMATPALVGDRLLLRTAARLYCIQNGGK